MAQAISLKEILNGGCGNQLLLLLFFFIGTIIASFDLQVVLIYPNKFRASSEKEIQNRFSRLQASLISDRNNFSYFNLQLTLMFSFKFLVDGPFGSGKEIRKFKIDFQDGRRSGHLVCTNETILAMFNLKVILILHNKFRVN